MRYFARRPSGSVSSRSCLEALPEPAEAARDSARDRSRRDTELLADRPVALVTAEEAVEHLLALLRQLLERLADREGVVELLDGSVDAGRVEVRRFLTFGSCDPVEADPPGELRDPGAKRLRVPE